MGKGRLAVQHRVVDHLRSAPELVRVEPAVGAEELSSGAIVDVFAGAEGVDERRFSRHVREHA